VRRRAGAIVASAAALLVAFPQVAAAVTDQELKNLGTGSSGPAPAPHVDSGLGSIGRVLFGLVVVVAVIIVAYLGLRRAQRGRVPGTRSSGSVEVLETTTLAPGRNLHLVRVGDRVLLVGATDHGIATLQAYDHDSAVLEGLVPDDLDLPEGVDPALAEALGRPARRARRGVLDVVRERTLR
jgi:flagellar biosynthetic protein FliO